MFYYVQLWQSINAKFPTVQQRVQAPSEGHAVVQVMRKHRLSSVDRAWVSYSAKQAPTLRLAQVVVKGNFRHWKHELEIWPLHVRKQQLECEVWTN